MVFLGLGLQGVAGVSEDPGSPLQAKVDYVIQGCC